MNQGATEGSDHDEHSGGIGNRRIGGRRGGAWRGRGNAAVSGSGLRTGSEWRVCDDGGEHGAFNNGASLQCQPYEEAVLRRAVVAGREVTDVTCITRSAAYVPQAAYAQPVSYAPQPVYRDESSPDRCRDAHRDPAGASARDHRAP